MPTRSDDDVLMKIEDGRKKYLLGSADVVSTNKGNFLEAGSSYLSHNVGIFELVSFEFLQRL